MGASIPPRPALVGAARRIGLTRDPLRNDRPECYNLWFFRADPTLGVWAVEATCRNRQANRRKQQPARTTKWRPCRSATIKDDHGQEAFEERTQGAAQVQQAQGE